MNSGIEIKLEERNIVLTFPDRPRTKIRNDLRFYGYQPIDPKDTRWKLTGFELNHQMAFASFKYLEKLGLILNIEEKLQKQLDNIITKDKIKEILRRGIEIKEGITETSLNIPGFERTLKAYQILPVLHINYLNTVANFSVPGSGKTTIVLSGYTMLKEQNLVDKLLVIGPYSSLMPWEEEIQQCYINPPSTIRIHGPKRYKIYLNPKEYEIFLITYHSAYNDIEYLIDLVNKDKFLIVLDESHYIKNIDGKISTRILRLSTLASVKIILSGTPIPNSIEDIYSQITFLYPESILGAKAKFKHTMRNHSNPSEVVKDLIYPIFTRITKSQMNLPSPKEKIIGVNMSHVQETLYRLVDERIKNIIEVEAGLVSFDKINEYKKCKIIRLRQIASNVNLLTKKSWEYNLDSLKREISRKEEPKTDKQILRIIDDLESYPKEECSPKLLRTVSQVKEMHMRGVKKIIVWSDFILNLKTLYNYFSQEYGEDGVFLIIGNTPKAKAEDIKFGSYTPESREYFISKFKQNPKEFNILVANPQACAESISLHKVCHDAIYNDRSYNCGQFIQSKDRIHRIGLNPDIDTTYYYLISTSQNIRRATIDEIIHNRLIEKENDMLEILNDTTRFEGSNDPSLEEDEELYDEV